MQNTQAQNGTNGENGNGQLPDLTNREILKILLDEIADVRRELKDDIAALSGRMDKLEGRMDKLEGRMDKLETEFQSLRMEIHQNQITFMKGNEDLEKRVVVLEGKVGQ